MSPTVWNYLLAHCDASNGMRASESLEYVRRAFDKRDMNLAVVERAYGNPFVTCIQ